MLINLFAKCSSVPKWTITLLPVSLLCLHVPPAALFQSSMWGCAQKVLTGNMPQFLKPWGIQGSPTHPHPPMAHLNNSSLCLPWLTSALNQLPAIAPSSPFQFSKGFCVRNILSTMILQGRDLSLNVCQGSNLHLYPNLHSPLAFLLICPITTQSRNTLQGELYSHT